MYRAAMTVIAGLALSLAGSLAGAAAKAGQIDVVLDFEGLSGAGLNQEIPDLTFGNLVVGFDNLELVAEGSAGGWGTFFGFPSNTLLSPSPLYGGQSISGFGQITAGERPVGFTRTITFSQAIAEVSLVIADLDFGSDTDVRLYDAGGLFSTKTLFINSSDALGDGSNLVSGNGIATPVTFTGSNGITRIEIIGTDPMGIDNIAFSTEASGVSEGPGLTITGGAAVPMTGAVGLLLMGGGLALRWGQQR